jgi:hypothetical protein
LNPPWALNLTSSGSLVNTGVDMYIACSLTSIGSGVAAGMDGDIPDYLACIGSGVNTITARDMSENWIC